MPGAVAKKETKNARRRALKKAKKVEASSHILCFKYITNGLIGDAHACVRIQEWEEFHGSRR
jgi:hypothetical protein